MIINAGLRIDMLNPDEETLVSVDSIGQYGNLNISERILERSWNFY